MPTDRMGLCILFGEISKDAEGIRSQGVRILSVFSSVFLRVHPWFEFFTSLA